MISIGLEIDVKMKGYRHKKAYLMPDFTKHIPLSEKINVGLLNMFNVLPKLQKLGVRTLS